MHELTGLIRQDMKPALGVTEPGAIAFAVASAKQHTKGEILSVKLRLNSGMYKNAFTCGIPGSDKVGNAHAAALGAVGADPDKGWNAWRASHRRRPDRRRLWWRQEKSRWKWPESAAGFSLKLR